MSAAGKRYMTLIHALPCVVHWGCYGALRNCDEAHHLEFVRGAHSDHATVPLCEECHHALHQSRRRSFYRAHKLDDIKLLAWTAQLLQSHYEGKFLLPQQHGPTPPVVYVTGEKMSDLTREQNRRRGSRSGEG